MIMERLANYITDSYIKKGIIDKEKRDIYCYGFKLIIADIINYLIIITGGIVFHRIFESIVFLICLCGLRQFSGGFHAKTFWLCRLSMIATYISVVLITDRIMYMDYIVVLIALIDLFSVGYIGIFSPVEHPNKPLSDRQKRKNKIRAIITSGIMSVVSVILTYNGMKLGVTISITLLAVVILMIIGSAVTKGGKRNVCMD